MKTMPNFIQFDTWKKFGLEFIRGGVFLGGFFFCGEGSPRGWGGRDLTGRNLLGKTYKREFVLEKVTEGFSREIFFVFTHILANKYY